MKTLRGKPLDAWNRREHQGAGRGLNALYEEADAGMRAETDKRIAALEALTDAQFATLDDYDIAQWVNAWQGFGDSFAKVLAAALPQAAPIPPFTAAQVKAFLFIHGPDDWPVVTVRNPWARLAVGGRDQVMTHDENMDAYPVDAMSSRPQLWWMPHGSKTLAHLQLGYWPADGGQPFQLAPCGPSLHSHLSHSLQPHYVPPKSGFLRARIGGWAESQSRQDELGAWSPPVALTHVFLSTKARDAWTPTYIQDVPESELAEARGRRVAWAQHSTLQPNIPIEVAGDAEWRPPNHEQPLPLTSDWKPPPLPETGPTAPVVSNEARAWLQARAKRYGNSRSTGRFWRELAEMVA